MPRRSLWGYSPSCVKKFTEQIQLEHETRRSELEKRIRELELETDEIRQEVKNFTAPKTDSILSQIADKLLEAHLEQSCRILEKQEMIERISQEEHDWKHNEEDYKQRLRDELTTLMKQLDRTYAEIKEQVQE